MKNTKADCSQIDLTKAIEQARKGDPRALNRFFSCLFEKGKHTLVGLTKSEETASSFFTDAIVRFKQKFVNTENELPHKNIEGYIFTMAKFAFYDAQRQKKNIPVDSIETLTHDPADSSKTKMQYMEEERILSFQEQAMKEGIKNLTGDCQQLFETILSTGEEKSGKLYKILGWKNARQVTTRKHDCTKQLKIKASMILEDLLKKQGGINDE